MRFTKKMKKLLITSAVLAFIGIVLCIVGLSIQGKYEESLFSQKQDSMGQYVYTYEFDASMIKKISLELSYADVRVISTNGTGYIEMVNFPLDNFRMTVGATTVSVEERSMLGNLFSFNFDGIRNYFNSVRMAAKSRTVNIYVPDTADLRLLELDVYSGDVVLEHLRADTDARINIDYGSVIMNDVISSGEFSVSIVKEGNLTVDDSVIASLDSALTYGYESLTDTVLTDLKAEITKGYFKYETGGDDLLSGVLKLKTEKGRVRFGGDIYENGSFSQGIEYIGTSGVVQTVIDVHVGEGNIMITE